MRIVVHDYAGHPFQVQLSRALARSGHEVAHLYCAGLTGPQGAISLREDDPGSLSIRGLASGAPVAKENFARRWRQEAAYGRELVRTMEDLRPDVVLSANTPVLAQVRLSRWCVRARVPMVFWVQDLLGEAASALLGKRFGVFGRMVGGYLTRLEREALADSAALVAIAPDFVPRLRELVGSGRDVVVIQNWTPLEEIPRRDRDNAWRRSQGLGDRFVFMYSGSLGMKHNPGLLLELAKSYRSDPSVVLVVNSEGAGSRWLRAEAEAEGLSNLLIPGFQPYDELPDVLGAADAFLAVLEPEAANFSVPSKVLTYLAAGRPVVLSVKEDNLAAEIVRSAGAGRVVSPGDVDGFLAAAEEIRAREELRRSMGAAARAYAEGHFDIDAIRNRFEVVLRGVVKTASTAEGGNP